MKEGNFITNREAENIQNDFPYLGQIELEMELDESANSIVILSGNLSSKLIGILRNLSKGKNRYMSVTFNICKNRVVFRANCINGIYPLLDTLKKYS